MIRATRILTRGGIFVLIVAMSLWEVEAMAVDGLVTIRSDRGPAEAGRQNAARALFTSLSKTFLERRNAPQS